MSRNYIEYNQYLGARRCCDLRGQGPRGFEGPTGPAAIGEPGQTGPTGPGITGPTGRSCKGPTGDIGPTGYTGPASIATSVIPLTYNGTNTATIPTQTAPIQYYSLNMAGPANELTTITYTTSLSAGYKAIIFINGSDVFNHKIGALGTGVVSGINYFSSDSQKTLTQSSNPKGVLSIYSDGTYTYVRMVLLN